MRSDHKWPLKTPVTTRCEDKPTVQLSTGDGITQDRCWYWTWSASQWLTQFCTLCLYRMTANLTINKADKTSEETRVLICKMETEKKTALNKIQELKLYMKIMTCMWCRACFGCSLPLSILNLCVFTIWSKSLTSLSDCEWVYILCICVRLTGGPAGPGGPLLSWVQVQALGMAGQSASFLWMITAWWGWHEDNKTKQKTERKKRKHTAMIFLEKW